METLLMSLVIVLLVGNIVISWLLLVAVETIEDAGHMLQKYKRMESNRKNT